MSKEKRRVPKLRFPGFTEDWEQRKFLDLLDAQYGIRRGPFGSSLKKDSFVKKSDYVVYEQQNAIYDNYETRYFISKEKYNELIRFNIQPGDFIMSGAGTIGRISMVPDGIKKGVFNQALIRFKVNKDSINPLYFLKFMQSDMMQKQLTQANPGSAMTNLVPMDELKKWDVTIPSLEEQNKISTFINQIDEFITLHQRKLDNLKLKKKALLQKLFPKNGERYPELRFPGFTDAWEQRKLNEFLSVSNFKNTENKYNKKDVLSVSGDYGIVNQIDFQGRSFAGASVSNYGVVEKGDIVYTKSPLKLNPYGIIKTNRLNNGIVSTLYAIYKTKENCNSKFIEHYFNLDSRLNQYLKPLVNKGAKNDMKVSSENVLIGEVCFPKITEQALIADFLDCLDIYITLHQRKLEHLKLQKKALLQQMFV